MIRCIPLIVAAVLVLGCASPKPLTPQQKAENDAYFAERKTRIAKEKAEFEADVITRTSSDPSAPPRVTDPGYPVASCISPAPSPAAYSLKVPPIGEWVYEGVICDNTEAGQKVLAWREWYCRAIESDPVRLRECVVSAWSDGYQNRSRQYWGIVVKRVSMRLSASTEVTFVPSTWQPRRR